MSKTSSFNTKRRKDNKKAAAAAPLAASKTDDVNDATKTTTTVPKRPNNKKATTPTLTFQEKIAKAHAEKNAKRQKQMFVDVVLSKEFGTYN
jgi:2-C-methyl-D-erythritol 4-phosphate cytidylyltransferase